MIRWLKIKLWVSRLNAADATMRAEAIRRLRCLEPSNLPQLLCGLLNDAKRQVRLEATRALGGLGNPAIEGLITASGDANHEVRLIAAQGLIAINPPDLLQPLCRFLNDSDRQVRLEATRALGGLGNPAIEGLITASGDANHEVRLIAAQGLIAINPPDLLQLLCGLLNDPDSQVRLEATHALGGLGSAAIEGLTKALQDTSPAVRVSAARQLGDMDDARAIASLGAALTEDAGHYGGRMGDNGFVFSEAITALPKTSGYHRKRLGSEETAFQEAVALSLFNLSKAHPLPFQIRTQVESILEARAFRERVYLERLLDKLHGSSPDSRGSSDQAMITSSR